jgi:glyoxylase-like metal-dependent hydrolase (beta-lactamase superfamily II)
MIEQIIPGIYRIPVPLPGNPLQNTNAYLIRGEKRHLLVDSGFNWPACMQALQQGLDYLEIPLSSLDYFITHLHGDHSGLIYRLSSTGARVYCSQIDASILSKANNRAYWQELHNFYTSHGFPRETLHVQESSLQSQISGGDLNYIYIHDGDEMAIGPYHFIAVSTPGHTPGHTCLYEPEQRLLIAGDHILGDITPNITAWKELEDSLGRYLDSLDKIKLLNIELVLPGHRRLIRDCSSRIAQIEQHHRIRLQEVLSILENGPMYAYQVAGLMSWDMSYPSWEDYPPYQQWFATGEAIAHLDHLTEQRLVKRIPHNGQWLYGLAVNPRLNSRFICDN